VQILPHLTVPNQGVVPAAAAAAVVALPEEVAPAAASVGLLCAVEWLVHSPHSRTAAETRHLVARQQGPVG